ncbi:MAG: HD domain-containing protein [Candidatus Gracilibacteria bacterium]|nr:HD domain-containing protein [Candidatus Gracilibacteria bacterium]MDD3120375.1 HD domain-containing protein [Candidatus Gracilibacteria bacterium]MDD4530409.1 HD domain-containing protein [Candidatus Gracilibacteria bacterium]
MEKIIQQLEEEIREFFHKESSGHDIYHLKRTLNNALAIQEKEGGDKLIIAVSAFLHDIHRIIQNETGSFCSPKDSLPKVAEILNKTDLTEEQKTKILHCIEFHEEYDFSENGKTVNDIETLILQDADNLDAIGAIGIGRTFLFNGANGNIMWAPEKPFTGNTYEESNKKDPSTIHHFYSKLLKLKDNMNTGTAKIMANERHKFMELYLQEFFDEWNGKK